MLKRAVVSLALLSSASAFAADDCAGLPNHSQLMSAVNAAIGGNGGLGFPMWATVVNRFGRVCAVAKSNGDPWPGSRVISAQKANTATAFSNNKLALSTANLFSAVQPGGSLYGLQHSNPVNTLVAYRGTNSDLYGTAQDPMNGLKIGGINVFGGGLALYAANGQTVLGGLGVSGDTSCADHNIAWKMRAALGFTKIPGGVAGGTDNIIYDIGQSNASGFGHPTCLNPTPAPASNVQAVGPAQ